MRIQRKIVVDEHGAPKEAIIPWKQFCEIAEALGFDLDAKARADLRATRRDLRLGKSEAFGSLSIQSPPVFARRIPIRESVQQGVPGRA